MSDQKDKQQQATQQEVRAEAQEISDQELDQVQGGQGSRSVIISGSDTELTGGGITLP